MRKHILIGLVIGCLVFILPPGGAAQTRPASKTGGRPACLAISDGGGKVLLFWSATRAAWPAGGWQITDAEGRVLVPSVRPGAEETMKELSADDAAFIRSFARGLPAFKTPRERDGFMATLVLKAFTSYAFARAAGLTAALDNRPAGPQAYRIVGLASNGRPQGAPFISPAVDASIPTPPPASPARFRAASELGGVALYWSKGEGGASPSAAYYRIERKAPGKEFLPVKDGPVLLAAEHRDSEPAFYDPEPPADQELTYRVFGVDAFGRRSVPVEGSLFYANPASIAPPSNFKATGAKGKVVLEWDPPAGAKRQGIRIERAFYAVGPFAVLTSKGLAGNALRFEDAAVKGGLTYYYRVRSIGLRDAAGPPSAVVSALAFNASPPAQPKGLRTTVERTRVRLAWTAVEGVLLAGYLVERKPKSGEWSRLNEGLAAEPGYDDFPGALSPGIFSYRVRAIALDNQESPPSAAVEVVVPDRSLPPAPDIVSTDGSEGKTVVRFKPGLPESKSAQFVVLRAANPRDEGVVLGRPLGSSVREYTDPFVAPGETYWYRLVAFDKAGNRSEPSAAVSVTIGMPPLPAPDAPRAVFAAAPFPHVKVSFDAPPTGLEVVLERRRDGEADWLVLSATSVGREILDANPPSNGTVYYRIFYRAANGADGPSSPAVEIRR
jgi:hypothetical protein